MFLIGGCGHGHRRPMRFCIYVFATVTDWISASGAHRELSVLRRRPLVVIPSLAKSGCRFTTTYTFGVRIRLLVFHGDSQAIDGCLTSSQLPHSGWSPATSNTLGSPVTGSLLSNLITNLLRCQTYSHLPLTVLLPFLQVASVIGRGLRRFVSSCRPNGNTAVGPHGRAGPKDTTTNTTTRRLFRCSKCCA